MTWSGDQPAPGAWGPPPQAAQPPGGGWGPPAGGGWGPPPGGPPGFPELPPHLKPKNGPAILISMVCGLVVLAFVGGLISLAVYSVVHTDAGRAKAGDCVDFTVEAAPAFGKDVGDAYAQRVDCDDDDAAYLVGLRFDDLNAACPGEAYTSYFDNDGLFGSFKLCLIPNVADGDCFVESETHTDRFPCSEGRKRDSIKVLRVAHGVADESRCAEFGEDVLILTFPTPATTICFEPFGASSADGGRNT